MTSEVIVVHRDGHRFSHIWNRWSFIGVLTVTLMACHSLGVAQTFNSGSTGADGVFLPPNSVPQGTTVNGNIFTVPLPASGIFNFTTVEVPLGKTVTFARNAANTPVTLLAVRDVMSGVRHEY